MKKRVGRKDQGTSLPPPLQTQELIVLFKCYLVLRASQAELPVGRTAAKGGQVNKQLQSCSDSTGLPCVS